MKKEISKEEYRAIIDEIIQCTTSLEAQIGEYTTNAITRLIDARIHLNSSTREKKEATK